MGQLHDASIIVCPSHTFIWRLIDLLNLLTTGLIRLNIEARSDILWWYHFITHWNGLSMMLNPCCSNPDVVLISDASGSWGCGAFCGNAWFKLQWPAAIKDSHITAKTVTAHYYSCSYLGSPVG